MPVTKSEFVDQVANRAQLGKKEATAAVDAVLDTIEETLQRGSDVTFSGFGKFSVAERGARPGRPPAQGRADPDRRLEGPTVHRRVGPEEVRQRLIRRAG